MGSFVRSRRFRFFNIDSPIIETFAIELIDFVEVKFALISFGFAQRFFLRVGFVTLDYAGGADPSLFPNRDRPD